MNRVFSIVCFLVVLVSVSQVLYSQQRVLIPLDSVALLDTSRSANFWVDTVGIGVFLKGSYEQSFLTERLHTNRPHRLDLIEDVLDLTQTFTVGDTMRRSMFKPVYQSWYDSLQVVAREFGGAEFVLESYSNHDSSWNSSYWTVFVTDTILSVAVKNRIQTMNLYTIHSFPRINLFVPDPFIMVLSIAESTLNKLSMNSLELFPVPASQKVHIILPVENVDTRIKVEIYSEVGKILLHKEVEWALENGKLIATLDISNIPSGIYVVRYGDYSQVLSIVR